MLAKILNQIQALGCEIWEIKETTTLGWEFYLIRHELDQHRVTDVKEYNVTLYRPIEDEDGTRFLGSASGKIAPTASDADMQKALADIYFQASLVRNPFYTLNDQPVVSPENKPIDVEAIARDFFEAMHALPETATEDVNSYEIFVKDITKHYLNSNGVEYTVRYPSSMIEVVVNARTEGHEIELYRNCRSGTCDGAKLAADVTKALHYGKDRLGTEPTPKLGRFDVLFSTDDATRIYEYFVDKTSADLIVRQLSDWTVGKAICENHGGDTITVEAVSSLGNSSADYPIDDEGAAIYDRFLIRDGVVENNWGSRQFSQYLGLEKSSQVRNAVFSGGARTEEEVRSGDYLEIVEFSDFQVDPMAGDIAGEIRLGYLHQGGKVSIVSGGSVTGSMAEVLGTMEFSKETEQYDNLVIPKVTKLKGLKITGIA